MSDKDLTPSSWEGGFGQISASASAYVEIGGSAGGTYFVSKNTTWEGVSFDVSVGIGGGGGGFTVSGSYTYYKRAEIHITKTKLMTVTRLAAKWNEVATMGLFPGTAISDAEESVRQGWTKTKDEFKKWATDWPSWW